MRTPSRAPQTATRVPSAAAKSALSYDEAQRQLWNLNAVIRLYQEVEIVCQALLIISGIGTVLYSASMFLHPI